MSAYDEGAHIELGRCRRALHRVTAERDKLARAYAGQDNELTAELMRRNAALRKAEAERDRARSYIAQFLTEFPTRRTVEAMDNSWLRESVADAVDAFRVERETWKPAALLPDAPEGDAP